MNPSTITLNPGLADPRAGKSGGFWQKVVMQSLARMTLGCLRLELPDGREVNVERTPTADERHADLTFAIDDAFKHARQQLQDQVRALRAR